MIFGLHGEGKRKEMLYVEILSKPGILRTFLFDPKKKKVYVLFNQE